MPSTRTGVRIEVVPHCWTVWQNIYRHRVAIVHIDDAGVDGAGDRLGGMGHGGQDYGQDSDRQARKLADHHGARHRWIMPHGAGGRTHYTVSRPPVRVGGAGYPLFPLARGNRTPSERRRGMSGCFRRRGGGATRQVRNGAEDVAHDGDLSRRFQTSSMERDHGSTSGRADVHDGGIIIGLADRGHQQFPPCVKK